MKSHNICNKKHRKDCETALYGKESLYQRKGLFKERLYLKTGFIERKASLTL